MFFPKENSLRLVVRGLFAVAAMGCAAPAADPKPASLSQGDRVSPSFWSAKPWVAGERVDGGFCFVAEDEHGNSKGLLLSADLPHVSLPKIDIRFFRGTEWIRDAVAPVNIERFC
ncbi:MAG: hypothetical protein K2X38_18920 [Gemmataceae bacterium]|nr:hypothetical protein [Gemmataceae bacterium]